MMTSDSKDRSSSSTALQAFLERVDLPRWAPVRLMHDTARLADVAAAVAEQFQRTDIGDLIRPGARIALTAGSRGIDRIDQVIAASVAEVKRRGAEPFIVPAMGSHGGATVEGQLEVLWHYGISEERMGCQIRASMEVVELGQLPSGERLYTDHIAYTQADLIIPINRLKPHTAFHGPLESGLFKMITIGLGKQHGADSLHASGFGNFPSLIPLAGRFVLERLPIPFGIALVENGDGKLALLEAIPAGAIEVREAQLLDEARRRMARLPVEKLDVLVVEQMGKDISGAGMDPNVIGRSYKGQLQGDLNVQRVVVLDLTDATEGNAAGVGVAEFCTERLAAKIDRAKTYMNQLTSRTPQGSRLPVVAANDRTAIQMAIASLSGVQRESVRVARIKNTKDLTNVWVSEALLPELLTKGQAELLDNLAEPIFNADGNLW